MPQMWLISICIKDMQISSSQKRCQD